VIRHVVLFRKKSGVTDEAFRRQMDVLATLDQRMDEMVAWWVDVDPGSPTGWDAVLVADFPDAQTLAAYHVHPEHAAFATAVWEMADVAEFDGRV
jgi:hypothetical protein